MSHLVKLNGSMALNYYFNFFFALFAPNENSSGCAIVNGK